MSLLSTRVVAKPWGRTDLMPPFTNPEGERIGEIWFEPVPDLDQLLVKYIFTSENLSVQCHPSDDQTIAKGIGRQGKEECWLVLDAEPDARLAIGFDEPISASDMRSAAADGSIEQLLTWHPVAPGDFFYIPANTVHAIGAGITLVEVQQNSDITYRLYDYGRPREIHLEEGMEVACGRPYDQGLHRRVTANEAATLVEGPYFRLDRVHGQPSPGVTASYPGRLLVLPLDGPLQVDGVTVTPGQCALAPDVNAIAFNPNGLALLTTSL